jgi:hypothetical protein
MEAARYAADVAKRMTHYMQRPYELGCMAEALAALAGRLPDKEAAAAVAPSARALTETMIRTGSGGRVISDYQVALSGCLAALAPRLAESEAAAAVAAISGRLARTTDSGELAGLGQALAALAERRDRKQTAAALIAAGEALIARLAVEQEALGRDRLAAALTAIGRHLDDRVLIGLLGDALCSGRAQSVLVDELGRRKGRSFADVWSAVAAYR